MNRTTQCVLWACACTIAAGCHTVPAEHFQDTQRRLQLAEERVRALEQQIAEQQQSAEHLRAELARLRGMARPGMMDELVSPVRIELASLSGPTNSDGQAGDDGLVLYVRPIDRDGHVIKAAGQMKVTLLDPLEPAGRNVLAQYDFDVAATRRLWYGRLMTQHFTVRCPWPAGQRPAHDELTAHVAFTDLLTGRLLTTQQSYRVTLPPTLPASAPSPPAAP